MSTTIGIPEKNRDSVAALLAAASVDHVIVSPGEGELNVLDAAKGETSDSDNLMAGGRIDCRVAWAMSKKHGIPLSVLGELINLLDIRIRNCALGCFR